MRCYVGGVGGKIGYYEEGSLTYVAMTDIPSGRDVLGIFALDEDDVWASLYSLDGEYPAVAHWDGASWTETSFTFAFAGAGSRWQLWSIWAAESGIVYAAGGRSIVSTTGELFKLKSGVWSSLGSLGFGTFDSPTAMVGSGEDDVWISKWQYSDGVHSWNGSAISDGLPRGVGNIANCTGIALRSNGDVFVPCDGDNTFRKMGALITDTWTTVSSLNVVVGTSGHPQVWTDPETDDIWLVSYEGGGWKISLYDSDDAWTHYASYQTRMLSGYRTDDGARIFVADPATGNVYERDPDTGTVSSIGPLGYTPRTLFGWTPAPEVEVTYDEPEPVGEYCTRITDGKDNELNSTGRMVRDGTVVSRCRFRLTCRRGEYWADNTLGSRLHTIRTLRDARGKAQAYCQEALQDMIDAGEVLSVVVSEHQQDVDTGAIHAGVSIELPEGEAIDLGQIPVGS